MKARIGRRGNQDNDQHMQKNDSAKFPPIGIRLILSISVMFKCRLAKIDITAAFLKTGEDKIDTHVVPPRKCLNISKY